MGDPCTGAIFASDIVILGQQTKELVQATHVGGLAIPSPASSVSHNRLLSQLPLDHVDERTHEPEELLVLAYLHALNAMWATNQDWKMCRYNGLVAVAIEKYYGKLFKMLDTGSFDQQERCRKALKSIGLALRISWMVRPFSSRLKKYDIELDEDGQIYEEHVFFSTECDMKVIEILLDFPRGIQAASVYQDL